MDWNCLTDYFAIKGHQAFAKPFVWAAEAPPQRNIAPYRRAESLHNKAPVLWVPSATNDKLALILTFPTSHIKVRRSYKIRSHHSGAQQQHQAEGESTQWPKPRNVRTAFHFKFYQFGLHSG